MADKPIAKITEYKNWVSVSSLIVLALMALLIPFTLGNVVKIRGDFYNELWGPAHLLVNGKNPYDTSSLNASLPAVWLPMAIGFFAPLGWLDEKTATWVWFMFNVGEVLAILFLARGNIKSPSAALTIGIMAYFFPPTINHFALGQFSITAALCMTLAVLFAEREFEWPAAFFLALGMTKPQLGFLAAPGLGAFYFQREGLRGVARFGFKTVIASFLMSMPLFAASPNWIMQWVANMRRNPQWAHPSFLNFLPGIEGGIGIFIRAGALATGIVAYLYLWRRTQPDIAMRWTLGLTTILSPYIWSWDFTLLLPLWIFTFAQAKTRRKIFMLISFAIGWIGMAYVQIAKDANNLYFWWVPLWFMGTILIVTKIRSSNKDNP